MRSLDLHGRELHVTDVPACLDILRNRHQYEKFDLDLVAKLFPRWILDGILQGCVVEQVGAPLCFGASLFITEELARSLCTKAVPHLGAKIVQASVGQRSCMWHPILPELTEGGGRLNIVIIHSGLPPLDCDEETASRIRALMMQGFLQNYDGYDLGRIFVEAFGESERALYSRAHFAELARFNSSADRNHGQSSTHSYLLLLTRERVVSLDVHPLLPVFTRATPKCLFTAGEQAMLSHALKGHTDEELARILRVSLSAVKKRWIGIFERAERAIPERGNERRDEQKRGAQKRHVLLRYLRNRPEELRPFPPVRKGRP